MPSARNKAAIKSRKELALLASRSEDARDARIAKRALARLADGSEKSFSVKEVDELLETHSTDRKRKQALTKSGR